MSKRDRILVFLISIAAIGIFVFIGCPSRLFFGVPCPGCGMSRACLALFRLDFEAAFYFHPLVVLVPLVGIYLLIRVWIKGLKKLLLYEKICITIIFFVYILVFLIRLSLKDPVLEVNFNQSILFKIVELLKGGK